MTKNDLNNLKEELIDILKTDIKSLQSRLDQLEGCLFDEYKNKLHRDRNTHALTCNNDLCKYFCKDSCCSDNCDHPRTTASICIPNHYRYYEQTKCDKIACFNYNDKLTYHCGLRNSIARNCSDNGYKNFQPTKRDLQIKIKGAIKSMNDTDLSLLMNDFLERQNISFDSFIIKWSNN